MKEKLHEIEFFSLKDAKKSSPPKKKKMKKKSLMQLENKKRGVNEKPKSLKSKGEQVCSENSKKSKGKTRKRMRHIDLYDDVESMFSIMERAERVLSRLDNRLPHLLKCMLPSNVSHGFWLHLPAKFCSLHLPNEDTSIVLVDEWDNEYKISYLLGRHGFSAGWRGFSISHRLLKGDILIFHLTGPCRFKVHIVRVNSFDVVSAALCLMNLDTPRRETDSDGFVKKENKKHKKTKYVEPFLLDTGSPSENVEGENAANSNHEPVMYKCSSSDDFTSEVLGGSENADQHLNKPCYSGTVFAWSSLRASHLYIGPPKK